MFGPQHHQGTRYVVPVRKQLGVRTIFNFLGPLTNPAGATRQLIGVSDARYLETIAGALGELGCRRALVVASADGMDEVSIAGETRVLDVSSGRVTAYTIAPEQAGLARASLDSVRGGTPAENADTSRRILSGEPGSRRDLAVLNAGAALVAAELASTIEEGARLAEEAIDSGSALDAMERFVAKTVELAPQKQA